MAEVVLVVLGAVLGALLTVTFAALKDWLLSRRSIRVSVTTARGPTSREYGFTETSLKVTVKNNRSSEVSIQDIRLMFAQEYGLPVTEAPPPRSHPELPLTMGAGTTETWHFPAEKLATLLGNISSEFPERQTVAKLRPQATTTTGKVYRGRSFRFSMDINSHWP